MINKIIRILKKEYPENYHEKKPYRVLISCILSLRTKDEVTYPASERLFKLADTPKTMLNLSEEIIRKTIYPVGFYKTKSKTILGISKDLVDIYNSHVPDEIDELLKLKGVGRKTANLVVCFGFNKPGIIVDTHVHRISNRLGIVKTKTPYDTEFALRKTLPKKYWKIINEVMVRHGQKICRPISPICSECKIFKYCQRNGVVITR